MPELAEIEFFRKRWSVGHGARVRAVLVHPQARIYRDCDVALLKHSLAGARLTDSEAAAKQMLFHFTGGGVPRGSRGWLGIHLGMTGELSVEKPGRAPTKHDHFVLAQAKRQLVFNDPRMFGGVRFHLGPQPPAWWTRIAPAILSEHFTLPAVAAFLRRRGRAPIKAVLLMQERFPGVGNWMADEILWRAAIHPRRLAGSLRPAEVRTLHRECRFVCRGALKYNAGVGGRMPPTLNAFMPDSWLFNHRWRDGGNCPRTKTPLAREEVGGRTTCWSPARQKLR